GALESLDQALAAFLTERHATPVIAEEPADDDAALTASMQALDAQLKKSRHPPATPSNARTTSGLATLLDALQRRGGPAEGGGGQTVALAPSPSESAPPPPVDSGSAPHPEPPPPTVGVQTTLPIAPAEP